MDYRIIVKTYEGSVPVHKESTSVQPGIRSEHSMLDGRLNLSLQWEEMKEGLRGRLVLSCVEQVREPLSFGLEAVASEWSCRNYCFMPAAVYNGNRFMSLPLPYPPFYAPPSQEVLTAPAVITDIPHLAAEESGVRISAIQLLAGDMSTPACGYYDEEHGQGFLLYGMQRCSDSSTGYSIRENAERAEAVFSVQVPGVREKDVYYFGERPDGSGFYPDAHTPSSDTGRTFMAFESMELSFVVWQFAANGVSDFFRSFNRMRMCMETGEFTDVVPFSTAYEAVKQKFLRENYISDGGPGEGYLAVGTDRNIPQQHWQAGWVGGGISNLAFLLEDRGEAFEQGLATFRFILDRLCYENGWVAGIYADGERMGDAFGYELPGTALLVRKNADLLYFLLKERMYLAGKKLLRSGDDERIMALADAFVRLFVRYGQIGQFIDIETQTLLTANSASAAIAAGALALAYEIYHRKDYLDTARSLGEYYYREYAAAGILNGGPGEICQAPDSESAFGMLEAFVQLYETTGDGSWLKYAEDVFESAVTWVMSYDYIFPPESAAAELKVHSYGTVFANAQNKHSAPGICTLSGNSLLKLYRFTGNRKYLEWLRAISHSLTQFTSLEQRPVRTLSGENLPEGYMNERVQTSDWEGKHTVGGFLYGSNWPETTLFLTRVEVPGIYLDFSCGLMECFDHIRCRVITMDRDKAVLELLNRTAFDAWVTVLCDNRSNPGSLKHNYYSRMEQVFVKAGETLREQFVSSRPV